MKFIVILVLGLVMTACSQKKESKKYKTKMSVHQLVELEGEPDSTKVSPLDSESQMYKYDSTSYQVKGEYVQVKFRKPLQVEETIQYWRHKFAEDDFYIELYNETEHTSSFKLINKTKNIIVVFEQNGSVQRIAEDFGGNDE